MIKRCYLVLISVLLLTSTNTFSQFREAMVGVNGLTCSACTRTVEMSIRKLAFVKDVVMNLENTEGKVIFKDHAVVEIDKVAKAVRQAGFSVRYLSAVFHFDNNPLISGNCINNGSFAFQVIQSSKKDLKGDLPITFIGEEYQPRKEFLKLKKYITNSCTGFNNKIYYITM